MLQTKRKTFSIFLVDENEKMENNLFPSPYLTTSLSGESIAAMPLCCQQRVG